VELHGAVLVNVGIVEKAGAHHFDEKMHAKCAGVDDVALGTGFGFDGKRSVYPAVAFFSPITRRGLSYIISTASGRPMASHAAAFI